MLITGRGTTASPAGPTADLRSQVGVNFLQNGGAWPFINVLKGGGQWNFVDNSAQPPPSSLNSSGYPTTITNGGVKSRLFIPTTAQRSGNYVFRWTGTGAFNINGAGAFSGTDGEQTFIPGTGTVDFQITSGTNISNCVMMHADDVARYDAGNIVQQSFIDLIQEGGWGSIRFMDWQLNNTTNVRYWSDRKPLDYVYWHGGDARADLWAGDSTNSGDNYSCSAPSGWAGLVDKAMVCFRVNASATTTTMTLNVGGTGAKAIVGEGGLNFIFSTEKLLATTLCTCIYDAGLDQWIKYGGDTASGNQLIRNGVPIEALLQVCDETGTDPWIVRPYLSCDPETDWLEECATYCRDNYPNLVPRFEVVPNECWNSSAGFDSTPFAIRRGNYHFAAGSDLLNRDNWVGMVASQGGKTVSTVYSNDRTRYWAIVGVHTNSGIGTAQRARINSTLYVSQDGGDHAHDWITHIACTNYISPTYTAGEEATAAAAYGAGDAAAKLVEATNFAVSVLSDAASDGIPGQLTAIAGYRSMVDEYNTTIGLTFYEGGYSPDYLSGDSADLRALKIASKAVVELEDITLDFYNDLVGLGYLCPSHYYLSANGHAWSLFDPDTYATPSPQYAGIVTFNS